MVTTRQGNYELPEGERIHARWRSSPRSATPSRRHASSPQLQTPTRSSRASASKTTSTGRKRTTERTARVGEQSETKTKSRRSRTGPVLEESQAESSQLVGTPLQTPTPSRSRKHLQQTSASTGQNESIGETTPMSVRNQSELGLWTRSQARRAARLANTTELQTPRSTVSTSISQQIEEKTPTLGKSSEQLESGSRKRIRALARGTTTPRRSTLAERNAATRYQWGKNASGSSSVSLTNTSVSETLKNVRDKQNESKKVSKVRPRSVSKRQSLGELPRTPESRRVRGTSHVIAKRSTKSDAHRASAASKIDLVKSKRTPRTSPAVDATRKRARMMTDRTNGRGHSKEHSRGFSYARPGASWSSFGRLGVFWTSLRRLWQRASTASVRGRGDASNASSGQEQHRSTATERCSELNHRTRSASTNSGRNQIASKRSVSLSSERPTPSTDLTKSRDVSREKDSPTPETFDTHLALNQDAPAEPADTRLQNESGATRDHGNESHVSSAVNELSRAKAMDAYRVGQPQSLEADETVFKPAIMTPLQTQTNESCFAERPGPLDQAPEPMQPLIRSEKALQMPAKDQPAAAPVVEQATTAAERLQRPLETVQRTSTCTGTDEVPAAARQTLSVTTHDVIRTFRQRADTSSSGISRLEYRLIRSGCLSSPSLRSDGPGACSDQLAAVAAQSTRVGSGHRSGIRNESTSRFPGSAFRETMRPTPPRTSLLARSTSLERSPLLGGYRELVRTATLTPVTAAAASPSRPGSQIAPTAGRFSPMQHRSNERTLGGADRMATHDQLVPNRFEKGDFPPDAAQVATRAPKLPSVPIGTLRLPDRQLVGRPRTYWELSTPALPMTVADRAAAFHELKSDAGSLWRAEEQRTPGAVSGNATTPNGAMIPSSGTLKRRRLITPNAEPNTMTQVSGDGDAHRSFTAPQETRLASAASSSRLHQLIQSLKKSPSRSEDDAKPRFRRNDNHEDSVVTESETTHVLPQSVLAGQRQAGHDLGLDCSAELDAALDRMAQAIAARTKRHAVQRAAETGTTHPSTKLVPATWAPCPIPERTTPPKTAEDDHVSGADGNTGQVDPSALDRESHLCSVSAYAAPTFGEATKKRRQTVTQATDAHTRDWLPGSSSSRTVAEQSLVRARDAGKSSLGPRMITAPNDDDDDSGSGPREGTLLASLPSGSQQLAVTLPRIPEPWRPPSPPSTPPKSQFGAAKPEMIPMNADQAADTTSALTTKAASLSSEAAVFSSVEVPPHAQGPRTNEKAGILPIPVRAEAATETRTSSITGSERDESAAKSLLPDGTTLAGINPPICIEKSLNQELHCEAAVKDVVTPTEAESAPRLSSAEQQRSMAASESHREMPFREKHTAESAATPFVSAISESPREPMVGERSVQVPEGDSNAAAVDLASRSAPPAASVASGGTHPAPAPAQTFHFTPPAIEPTDTNDKGHGLKPPTWTFLSSPTNAGNAPFWFGSSTTPGGMMTTPDAPTNTNASPGGVPSRPTWPYLGIPGNTVGASPASLPWPSLPSGGPTAGNEPRPMMPPMNLSSATSATGQEHRQALGTPAPRRMLKARRTRLP